MVRVNSASCILIGPESGGPVSAVGTRRSGDAPLGYSCLTCWFQADFLGSGEFSLAVDLGRVAVPDPGRAEFLLAGDPSWVAEPAVRDAEFSLAKSPSCFPLRRRGRNLRGNLREASCGGVFSWFSEGAGEVRSPWYRVGGGAGSGTQFRYLSQGGRVTLCNIINFVIYSYIWYRKSLYFSLHPDSKG